MSRVECGMLPVIRDHLGCPLNVFLCLAKLRWETLETIVRLSGVVCGRSGNGVRTGAKGVQSRQAHHDSKADFRRAEKGKTDLPTGSSKMLVNFVVSRRWRADAPVHCESA